MLGRLADEIERSEVSELADLTKLALARKWLDQKVVWDVIGGVAAMKVGTTRYAACREDMSDVDFELAFRNAFPNIAAKMDEEAKGGG